MHSKNKESSMLEMNSPSRPMRRVFLLGMLALGATSLPAAANPRRSEERRVGKQFIYRW